MVLDIIIWNVSAVVCGERAGEAVVSSSSVLSEEPTAAEREEPGDLQTDHHRPTEPAGAARHETGDAQTRSYGQDLTLSSRRVIYEQCWVNYSKKVMNY